MAKKESSSQRLPKDDKKTAYWPSLLLFLYCFILYGHTVGFGFVLDDVAVIEQNAFVKQGVSGFSEIMSGFYWEGYWQSNAGLYRPLSLLFFAFEYQLSPDNPAIHHFFNVLYYALACVLLFRLLRRFLPSFSLPLLLLLTGLFLAHPIHTEVVANIKSRDEILALLFGLLALNLLIGTAFGKAKIYLAAICFFLALLSKEGAIVFLPMLLIYELLTGKKWIQWLRERWLLVVVAGLWLGIHQYVIQGSGEVITYTYNDNSLLAANSVMEQKATAIGLMVDYFLKTMYPVSFSYDYSFNQVQILGLSSLKCIAGLLLLAGLAVVFFRYRRSRPALAYSVLLFVTPLILTSNILFPIGATFAERFLFVPSVALIPLCIAAIQKWSLHQQFKTALFGVLIVWNVAYAITTASRSKDWESNYTLFTTDVAVASNSARAHYNYGTALMQAPTDQRAQAKNAFLRCLEIDSMYVDAMVNLSNLFTNEANYKEAKTWLEKALKHKPNDPSLLGSIGEICFRLNQFDEARTHLMAAQEKGNPINLINNYLGTIYFNEGNTTKAIFYFEQGVSNDPRNEGLLQNLANAYAMSGDATKAMRMFEQVLQVNPANADAAAKLQLLQNAETLR